MDRDKKNYSLDYAQTALINELLHRYVDQVKHNEYSDRELSLGDTSADEIAQVEALQKYLAI